MEDDEPPRRDVINLGLNLLGLAACVGAVLSTGGLAIFAGAVGIICLAGSFAISVLTPETPCERYLRECDQGQTVEAATGSTLSQSQDIGHSRHWRQSVEASRGGLRNR